MTQARIAQNQARFRAANEQIEDAADRHGLLLPDKKIPFICECADGSCHKIIRLSFREYEEVRADGRTFINAPAHETALSAVIETVEERDGYNIVRKLGHAGDVAEALDDRGEEDEAEAAS